MRTLYLHIGNHRTATSSIQAFMAKNREPLRKQGVLYPYGAKRHLSLINDLFSGKRDIATVSKDINNRCNNKKHPIGSVVLSDEDIATRADLSLLAGFKKYFKVKIIFSLRRQDLWLESWYLQNVKWQWKPALCHLTLDAFFARRAEFFWADYKQYITHLEALFGKENILLYPFERIQMPEGPIHAFAEQVGFRIDGSFTNPPNRNASLTPMVSEFMRCLPLDQAPTEYRAVFDRACRIVDQKIRTANPDAGGTLILEHAQRQQILGEHAEGNAWVAARYFDRQDLFFDPVPGPETPISKLALPASSYETMETLTAPLIEALIKIYTQEQAK
jgi:hypothetical protein